MVVVTATPVSASCECRRSEFEHAEPEVVASEELGADRSSTVLALAEASGAWCAPLVTAESRQCRSPVSTFPEFVDCLVHCLC